MMFIYSAPQTAWDVSFGQTFRQKAIREEADGTFSTFARTIVVDSSKGTKLPEWTVTSIRRTREDARELAARWNESGFFRETTREFGLETIDADEAARAERIAARRSRRLAA